MNERENQDINSIEKSIPTTAIPEMPEKDSSVRTQTVQQVPAPAAPPYAVPEQAPPIPPAGPYTQDYPTSGPQTPSPYNVPSQGAYPPPPPLPQVYYQLPQEKPVPPLNGLAIASMVLGIVSLVLDCLCCGMFSWLTALVGLVLGIVACIKGNRSGIVIAGLILNGLALVFALVTIVVIVLSADFQYQFFNSDFLNKAHI